jgi:ketol-acid reductoisomerase
MDLIYEKGFIGMLKAVSDTAKYGGLTVGPKIIDEHVKENMRKALKDVQSGKFAEEWIREHNSGEKELKALMDAIAGHEIERAGSFIRKTSGIEK